MRVGIIQSSYLPWRGYFDFIGQVDLFIFYDDVQFSKGSWRNRNKIKTPRGTSWITVPIKHDHLSKTIEETRIDETRDWRSMHLNIFHENYRRARHYETARDILEACLSVACTNISELNRAGIERICRFLEIEANFVTSAGYPSEADRTGRLITILSHVGADTYVSGPAAKQYLDESRFEEAGINLEYKTYKYPEYPQLWGVFEGSVTILDLIANCGKNARKYIHSAVPNERAVFV